MKLSLVKLATIALPALFCLSGCHVTGGKITGTTSCPVAGPTRGNCTEALGTEVDFGPNFVAQTAFRSDLTTIADGSYTLSLSAPSSVFSASASASPTTTISVTTDTGYSSSITVSLTPVSPAIAPVNEGDTVFSFNLPNTPAVSNWVQNVAANTTSTMAITTSAIIPLQANDTAGSVTINTVLTSNSTGSVSAGDVTLVRTASATPTCGVSGCGTMSEPGVGTN